MTKCIYQKPVIQLIELELEYSFAASSVSVQTTGVNSEYLESQWENEQITKELEW